MKKLVFLAFIGAASFELQGAELKDYVRTCKTIELDKASISAVCTADNGGKYKTAIRLRGVNNHDGVLTLEENSATVSKFHETCEDTSIDSKGLIAGKCLNAEKEYVWSTLDTRQLLKNYNGTLVYPLAPSRAKN